MHTRTTSLPHLSETSAHYRYDADGLLAQVVHAGVSHLHYFLGAQPVNLHSSGGTAAQTRRSWLTLLDHVVAAGTDNAAPALFASDTGGSVLLQAGSDVHASAYAPHGQRTPTHATTQPGFMGEWLDGVSGCHLLGATTHRPYSPALGIFLAPDPAAPFDAGGLNPLSYCAGDPVNRRDPNGHFWKWVIAGIGLAVAAVVAVASMGTAVGAIGALAAGGISALNASGAAAITGAALGAAGVAVEGAAMVAMGIGDDKAGEILGWVGLAVGVVGAAPGLAKAAAKAATRVADKAARWGQRLGTIRSTGLSGRGSVSAGRQMARHLKPGGQVSVGKATLHADDYIDVLQGHGAPFTAQADGIVGGRGLTTQMRKAAGEGYAFRRVELQMCYSATFDKYGSTAQYVANKTGVPTTGFKGKVSAGDALARDRVVGDRYTFHPQSGFARVRTSVINHALHPPVAAVVHVRGAAKNYWNALQRHPDAGGWM